MRRRTLTSTVFWKSSLATRHDAIYFTRAVSELLVKSVMGSTMVWRHWRVVDAAYSYLYKTSNDIIHKRILALSSLTRLRSTNSPSWWVVPTCARWAYNIWSPSGNLFASETGCRHRFEHAYWLWKLKWISGAVGNFAQHPPFVEKRLRQTWYRVRKSLHGNCFLVTFMILYCTSIIISERYGNRSSPKICN